MILHENSSNQQFQFTTITTCNYTKIQITREKNTNLTPFDGQFDRNYITAASNITTKPDSKHFGYNEIIQFYLDEGKIPGCSYLADEQWMNSGMCTDLEVENTICAVNANAHEQQEKMQDNEKILMWSKGISRQYHERKKAFK